MRKLEYFRMRFTLVSPLSIGSGGKANTDSDIVLDSRNRPVIPATSIAGVLGHYMYTKGEKFYNDFYGFIKGQDSSESKIRVYDGVLKDECFVSVRDNVALENKVGKDNAKFDREIAETGAKFDALIELRDADDAQREALLSAFAAFDAGELRLGSGTTRGFGQIEITDLKKAEFNLPDDRSRYVDFDPFDYDSDKCYLDVDLSANKSRFINISLQLKQMGAVSIRSYTVKNEKDIDSADYMQLSLNDGTPVIPGSSWAGAFRDRFKSFSCDEMTKKLFGTVEEKKSIKEKSKIFFSESRINNFIPKTITRTTIDRFSGGTKDSSLYSENTVFNGNCSLQILINKDLEEPEKYLKVLFAVICDLDRGYLSVGGLTAVGRGMFSVEEMTINGKDFTAALKRADISGMTGGAAE